MEAIKVKSRVKGKREKILNAAITLFGRNGYKGTTIDEITRASGITKGALYWHFKSKSELLGAVVERLKEEYLDRLIRETLASSTRAIDRFWYSFKFTARFGLEHKDLIHFLRNMTLKLSPSEDENVRAFFRILERQREFFKALIEAAQSEGDFRTDLSADLLAAIVLAAHDGIFLQWTAFKNLFDGRELAWAYRQILMAGMSSNAKNVFPHKKTPF